MDPISPRHIVDVSLCGLFLLDAARKVDVALKTPFWSAYNFQSQSGHPQNDHLFVGGEGNM